MAKDRVGIHGTDAETQRYSGQTTKCMISRKKFHENAKPVIMDVAGVKGVMVPKEFSTGSFGWYGNEKGNIEIGGELVKVQIQVSVFVVGSKEVPKDGGEVE